MMDKRISSVMRKCTSEKQNNRENYDDFSAMLHYCDVLESVVRSANEPAPIAELCCTNPNCIVTVFGRSELKLTGHNDKCAFVVNGWVILEHKSTIVDSVHRCAFTRTDVVSEAISLGATL